VAAVPIALLIVPLGLLVARPDRSVEPAEGRSIRIVNYNIHQGLNPGGQVDPEATARTIEALRPDVVMLQEIGRGWPIHIFMDTGEWLSRRLDMPFLYQPAADRQFGNAIMTRLPIIEHDGGFLPFGEGPQRRSYLRTRIGLGDGRAITLIDVHLQHQEDKPETRRAQIKDLLQVWGGEPRTVIAGDMNTQPDEANLDLFLDAGLVSVQDEAGLGHLPTATQEVVRGDRVDYVFVTPDVSFRDVAVPYSFASDHLPIAVTVSAP
jgi:endonuclease/exonuclease/phosphatase family metal-dependent hydrolase